MAASYDRAITVFSPDGHLFQVEYAIEAVKRGSSVVGVRAADMLVVGVERRATAKLQDPRTIRKIVKVDAHLTLAFAGLTADARVLIDKARLEAQSYRLTCEDAPSLEYMARFIARTQQKYTQRGGMRPFGVSCMLAGFGTDGQPQLYQTDPAGTHSAWKANAIGGKSSKNMREFLEKNYPTEGGLDEAAAVKLCIKTLLEVVDSGAKNMEICLIRRDTPVETMSDTDMAAVVAQIEAEAEEAKKASAGSSMETS
ncbi:proteasome subunit alpha type 7-1 [Tribonema minus]|uniref:Proteasome subunit alpha type n=1 Tax=Tribonema minus TaxID=303371 RepID=A0A835Z7L7_9STRA|nr:proteasome subunit alpha type 7-1 [Tribonema minus]